VFIIVQNLVVIDAVVLIIVYEGFNILRVLFENAYSRTQDRVLGRLTPKWAALSTTPQGHILMGKYII